MNEIIYRWIDQFSAQPGDWERLESVMLVRGWMALNREQCRVLVAEVDGALAGFVVIQPVPHLEPLYVVPSMRGTGLAEELADRMVEWLRSPEINARGWITIAEHPAAKQLCEREGMHMVPHPVYIHVAHVEIPGGASFPV